MSKRPYRVLSIDFDYFQKVNKHTILTNYPDGHDFTADLSTVIWATHYLYSDENARIQNVTCNQTKLQEIKSIIRKNSKPNIPVMICNSHQHIVDFITDNFDDNLYHSIDLVNIDMHHDCFNDNDELDCGNWISYLKQDYPTQLTWIANPISRSVYGLTEHEFDRIQTDFTAIKDWKFDLLFLCRSNMWLPPHLDSDFQNLADYITKHKTTVLIEEEVQTTRCIDTYVAQLQTAYQNCLQQQFV